MQRRRGDQLRHSREYKQLSLIDPIAPPTAPAVALNSGGARGFTLVELAVTVAIVGVLSTIAIPQYYHVLLRSKRAELPTNLDAIRTIEISYEAEWSAFTSCSILPISVPGRTAVSFPANNTSNTDWNLLGWWPDGRVYGQYEVRADNVSHVSLFRAKHSRTSMATAI